ncbi:2-amino-4-hydroxy-6-hydroxymethyldihydropteridine diphosphokinase [Variovorax ginsengisoli]|uniref:2-amino-4-hydroxy-6-hydroxymethyldihydropteridine pyrophosphokinase n=1 Tax=Variovorax ginsengisoli TaxID=363844 RepID=A0ABT8RYS3_9BURK|nr:2-amino-4-hydroxy-6-hydroxymethyldihydropteridine diphosphokinase [Variovorax ginsengisoli]MDN8612540.1 2-amino-4-hydroxy-6-hydroxymethyldihydropteridine diphosphokinase [Variovorax ginsengisoli]MDO1531710.1 2-amino-4-hydroxy-6-hydroxymethyldihydropteridine diphosphokinase [Variovorax ginsengisoli]
MDSRAFVAIGANLGDARATVLRAMDDLDRLPRTRVSARSSLYRSAPVDAGGPDFINAVVALQTGLDPHALLAELQRLEAGAGRERPYRNAPRTLDLDLLRHGDAVLETPQLSLPHPRLAERAFVLLPLAEIAPEQVTSQQLAQVADQRIERL